MARVNCYINTIQLRNATWDETCGAISASKRFNVMLDKNDPSGILIKKTLMGLNNFFNFNLIRQLPSF